MVIEKWTTSESISPFFSCCIWIHIWTSARMTSRKYGYFFILLARLSKSCLLIGKMRPSYPLGISCIGLAWNSLSTQAPSPKKKSGRGFFFGEGASVHGLHKKKSFRSRWLCIGLVPFLCFYWSRVRLVHENTKNNLSNIHPSWPNKLSQLGLSKSLRRPGVKKWRNTHAWKWAFAIK